ncbi:transcriptional regulator, LuxR family [Methylocella silvestris BL2]|uniref:Transcriptional regulator, LuxR family n=1 Tax=Methylocella silvestris (strain DSM 15510 / CIP 108128 / LMG 27833 / NCIMB 13906 / BL2) TaxID=395965 RepID=B8ES39_METSB|nr:LuxR C-terminal-related transcriptional regulator [Methylocella silvestris]ACK52254.1 transcriptional regulator, LuxR family [Methylocella silvestris BL2]
MNHDLIEQIEGCWADGGLEELLELVCRSYDLFSVIYICPSFIGFSLSAPFIVQPPCRGWADQQKIQSLLSTDPMVRAMSRTVLPMDWAALRQKSAHETGIHFLPGEDGALRQGLTIPVRGPSNSVWGLFIATSNESEICWASRRHELMIDLAHIAHYVHKRACDIHGEGHTIDLSTITRREIEALALVAQGKKPGEIAMLMRISNDTVKAHLDSARDKLQALNRVHAAAKALRAGLIS